MRRRLNQAIHPQLPDLFRRRSGLFHLSEQKEWNESEKAEELGRRVLLFRLPLKRKTRVIPLREHRILKNGQVFEQSAQLHCLSREKFQIPE